MSDNIPEKTAETYTLDDQIGFILRLAQQRHTALFSECFGGDLTSTQWALISKLKQVGESSQNLLGRLTGMDVATIQGVVERLKKRNIIKSKPDPEDKRRVVLSLSEEGEALYTRHLPNALKVTDETFADLSAEERTQLQTLLKKII
ncbi:MarR family winged helix-turn-helix transcriptional regulator [Rhizobium sp. L1K21]|uniref:MarR family winged helix-turn-helix transcriptional regulator n=1 Tax=Rhizobium sp. L1K21 TaxID=2954933 RepID=UPI00209263FB|nr:MarR family winged helix-turn-helix transcriptional regulator [Rhizobium sp. L1K21]MCO6187460.1 MarR family winged helix-turn-helix transcriptional regulator [Rhizobium sp. L1K21]